MVYFTAMLIFGFLNGACWFVSISFLRGTVDGPDPAQAPSYRATAIFAVAATTLASFVQFPAGYFLRLLIWAIASFGGLGLNPGRAALLFGYLAVSSFLSGLVVLGMMRFLQA